MAGLWLPSRTPITVTFPFLKNSLCSASAAQSCPVCLCLCVLWPSVHLSLCLCPSPQWPRLSEASTAGAAQALSKSESGKWDWEWFKAQQTPGRGSERDRTEGQAAAMASMAELCSHKLLHIFVWNTQTKFFCFFTKHKIFFAVIVSSLCLSPPESAQPRLNSISTLGVGR